LREDSKPRAIPKARISLSDEIGSISPLIIFYFSIIVLLIFLVSNVASAYIARRDLISRTESALSVAAQELDEFSYYYGSPLTDFLAEDAIASRTLRVPIDCADAAQKFTEVLYSSSKLSGGTRETKEGYESAQEQFDSRYGINVDSMRCDGYDISAKVSELHELPFQLRIFGITSFLNRIEAGTASFILSNEPETP
jgi:hypothetical protein